MPLPTVVPLKVTVDFGYGPHLRCCPLPWKQGYTATTFKWPQSTGLSKQEIDHQVPCPTYLEQNKPQPVGNYVFIMGTSWLEKQAITIFLYHHVYRYTDSLLRICSSDFQRIWGERGFIFKVIIKSFSLRSVINAGNPFLLYRHTWVIHLQEPKFQSAAISERYLVNHNFTRYFI